MGPRYMRDMMGYGQHPPQGDWPNGARIAVQIVLNYEEGGENNILHGDAASEAFLSEIIGAAPWPDQRHWNMESMYEYGARAGFWRLHRMLEGYPLTVFGVATALARSPAQVAAMKAANWEIACHGLKWIEYKDYTIDHERDHMQKAIQLHTEVVGTRPLGWYTGRCSQNTVALALQDGGFAYVADSYADDVPYWIYQGRQQQLIVPYTLDVNDMRFATAQGFNSGDQFENYIRDSFDTLYAEGGRMLSIGLHCRLVGRPGRAAALKRVLEYMGKHEGVWFATRLQIAQHWAKMHPGPLSDGGSDAVHSKDAADSKGAVGNTGAAVGQQAVENTDAEVGNRAVENTDAAMGQQAVENTDAADSKGAMGNKDAAMGQQAVENTGAAIGNRAVPAEHSPQHANGADAASAGTAAGGIPIRSRAPRARPSTLKRAAFVDTFGDVFEHSAWVAQQAYDLELGPAHDSIIGLHHALVRAFRAADAQKRLDVLLAHPDLAGKLAAAGRLTDHSTAEQASAGLNTLTDEERATFMGLNTQYMQKHGFPFIIAVKDNTKDTILKAFHTRLSNTPDDEFITACAQVERIAYFRVQDILS